MATLSFPRITEPSAVGVRTFGALSHCPSAETEPSETVPAILSASDETEPEGLFRQPPG